MHHRLIERLQAFQIIWPMLGAVGQKLIKKLVPLPPGRTEARLQHLGLVFPHQRVRIQRGFILVVKSQPAIDQPLQGGLPLRRFQVHQGQADLGQGWWLAQGAQAFQAGRAVEKAQQAQGGQFPFAVFLVTDKPVLVGRDNLKSTAVIQLVIGLLEIHLRPLADVSRVSQRQVAAQQAQRQGMAAHFAAGGFQFLVVVVHRNAAGFVGAKRMQQTGAVKLAEIAQLASQHRPRRAAGVALVLGQVRQLRPAGDQA